MSASKSKPLISSGAYTGFMSKPEMVENCLSPRKSPVSFLTSSNHFYIPGRDLFSVLSLNITLASFLTHSDWSATVRRNWLGFSMLLAQHPLENLAHRIAGKLINKNH